MNTDELESEIRWIESKTEAARAVEVLDLLSRTQGEERYWSVEDYDPVLRWHCGL